MRYRCTSCGYKFVPKTAKVPDRCPFCSAFSIRKEESAQDILNEVGKRQIPE